MSRYTREAATEAERCDERYVIHVSPILRSDRLPLFPALLGFLSEEDRVAHGIVTPTPKSLTAALEALENDIQDRKLDWLGKDFLEKYLKTKKMEEEVFGKMEEGERKRDMVLRY